MSTPVPFLIRTPEWVQAGPVLIALTGRNRSRPVRWVAAGAAVSILGNVLGHLAARRVGNNHWVGAIDDAAMFALYLIALSEWQVNARDERILQNAIFLLLGVYVALVAFVEDVSTFSRYAIPLLSLALIAAGAWTLIQRAFRDLHASFGRADWAWIVGGLAFYASTTLVSQPVGAGLLAADRVDLFTLVWQLRAVCVDLAFVLITVGTAMRPVDTVSFQ